MEFSPSQAQLINESLTAARDHVRAVSQYVEERLGLPAAGPVLATYERELDVVRGRLNRTFGNAILDVTPDSAPFLRAVLTLARKQVAQRLELRRPQVATAETLQGLEAHLARFDELASQEWFQRAEPLRLPQLHDFLTLELVDAALQERSQQRPRVHDEKFHLLQAPQHGLPDLESYRDRCAVRDRDATVAFLDIDRFKDINSRLGETTVDATVLPTFMRALERHVFVRGYAYRFGGDEYVLALPNMNHRQALDVLADLRKSLTILQYPPGVTITVSIGFVVVTPDSWLTNQEAVTRAESAKNFAKQEGRDRVATYTGQRFSQEELAVVLAS